MTAPNDAQLRRIFGTLLNHKLSEFDDVIKPLGDQITQATIEVYRAVSRELLPTPTKSHYLFNTRDLAKIIQGVMQATKTFYDNRVSIHTVCFAVVSLALFNQTSAIDAPPHVFML